MDKSRALFSPILTQGKKHGFLFDGRSRGGSHNAQPKVMGEVTEP
ncbi:MAG: hypothetical protein ABL923_15200 [Burkholderiaceae bacterium]